MVINSGPIIRRVAITAAIGVVIGLGLSLFGLRGGMPGRLNPIGRSRQHGQPGEYGAPGKPAAPDSPAEPRLAPKASPGYPAPILEGALVYGGRLSLGDLAGRVIVVTFFRTGSGACLAQMPALSQLHQEGSDSGLHSVVGVAVYDREDSVRDYMVSHSIGFPVLSDPAGVMAEAYNVTAVPTTFVMDGNAVIRDLRVGSMTYPELERAVRNARKAGP